MLDLYFQQLVSTRGMLYIKIIYIYVRGYDRETVHLLRGIWIMTSINAMFFLCHLGGRGGWVVVGYTEAVGA